MVSDGRSKVNLPHQHLWRGQVCCYRYPWAPFCGRAINFVGWCSRGSMAAGTEVYTKQLPTLALEICANRTSMINFVQLESYKSCVVLEPQTKNKHCPTKYTFHQLSMKHHVTFTKRKRNETIPNQPTGNLISLIICIHTLMVHSDTGIPWNSLDYKYYVLMVPSYEQYLIQEIVNG